MDTTSSSGVPPPPPSAEPPLSSAHESGGVPTNDHAPTVPPPAWAPPPPAVAWAAECGGGTPDPRRVPSSEPPTRRAPHGSRRRTDVCEWLHRWTSSAPSAARTRRQLPRVTSPAALASAKRRSSGSAPGACSSADASSVSSGSKFCGEREPDVHITNSRPSSSRMRSQPFDENESATTRAVVWCRSTAYRPLLERSHAVVAVGAPVDVRDTRGGATSAAASTAAACAWTQHGSHTS